MASSETAVSQYERPMIGAARVPIQSMPPASAHAKACRILSTTSASLP